ncbi:gluconokinase [Dyadobacter jejuensis]|uniref:Gluconokinase n=1 Tax=Dyadobacter jejuensis TaxID=1082580 RepID=A0A316A964_9BACT|nr:gluconokinase [Dyadobacter jejuensis]PWJ54295.1 gluconokinase [Dyadobacter jejuensis]
MPYLLGCDIGTTNLKITAFDSESGAILATSSEGYAMQHPHPGWSEQNPEEIYGALLRCAQSVLAETHRYGRLLGISFSSAMHGVLALDEQGGALSQLIIWADNRSAVVADALRKTSEGQEMYRRTGTPIHAMSPLCKLIWLREEQPDLFALTHKFIGIKEYLVFRLTGAYVVDYSIASATGLFNIVEQQWDSWTLQRIGLSEQKLSKAVSPYYQVELSVGNDLGVPAGTPLIMGASDGCLANLGSGSIASNSMTVTIGTSAATRVSATEPYIDPKMRTFCYLLDEYTYVVGGASNNGAVIFDWLKEQFFPDSSYEAIFKEAEKVSPGSDGLLLFPYLLGERSPLWSSTVRGGFSGLDIQHTRAHFVRAVMEGILLNLFEVGDILVEKNGVKTIYANGGFAHSSLWVQMLADVFGVNVMLNDTVETGTVGAVMMAMKSLGLKRDYSEMDRLTPVSVLFQYDPQAHEAYQKSFARFKKESEAFAGF